MSDIFGNKTEDEISEILLDYANDRLSADARTNVETAASNHSTIAEELEYYKGLSNALKIDEVIASDNELGWARLQKAIAEDAQNASAPIAANDNKASFWKAAAFVLGFIVIGQGAFQFIASDSMSDQEERYVPVTETVDGFQAQVTFNPGASEESVRKALRSADGRIISGPSSLGVYTIRFASEAARTDGVSAMQNLPGVVESVSAVSGTDR